MLSVCLWVGAAGAQPRDVTGVGEERLPIWGVVRRSPVQTSLVREQHMKKRTALSIAAGVSLIITGQAPAGVKPCRDKDGRVIECPKPARKASPRCKDEKGRFATCAKASEQPAAVPQHS